MPAGGLWAKMPVFAACFLVIVLASAGLPGLCGFVGELLVLVGTFNAGKAWRQAGMAPAYAHPALLAAISAIAVILAAVYLLTMYQKVMFGPLDCNGNPGRVPKPSRALAPAGEARLHQREEVRDLSWTERVVFGVIVVLALGMGLVPGPILSRSEASVDALVEKYRTRLAEARNKPDAPARMLTAGGGRAAEWRPAVRAPRGGTR